MGEYTMQLSGTPDAAHASHAMPEGSVLARQPRAHRWGTTLANWSGFLPFFLFCLLFEILPAVMILKGSLADSNTGAFTLNNYQRMLTQANYLHAFQTSISLSLVTALIGSVLGFLAAYGLYNLRISWLRNVITAFSSIAANFAGVPLAFAFVSTLGVTGFVTVLLLRWFHVDLYHSLNFSLYTFWGLVLAYTYFELP